MRGIVDELSTFGKDDRASQENKDDAYLPCCAQAPLHVFAYQTSSSAEKTHFEKFTREIFDLQVEEKREEPGFYFIYVMRIIDTYISIFNIVIDVMTFEIDISLLKLD